MPSSTWASDRSWQLYLDWCQATRRLAAESTELELQEFFRCVPVAKTTRSVRERAIRRRLRLPPSSREEPARVPGPAWRDAGQWAGLHESLASSPISGWPSGLRGRRDAFLLVAIHQGLTRGQASGVTSDMMAVGGTDGPQISISGAMVPTAGDPAACPGCAVIRWLNALGLNRSWGRGAVRAALIRQQHVDSGHVCRQRPTHADWVNVPTLMPSIDQHGWIDEHQPLSQRTVSAILARRQAEPIINPWPVASGAKVDRAGDLDTHHQPMACGQEHATARLDRLSRMLDEMEDQVEAYEDLIRRIEAEAATVKRRGSGK